MARTTGRRKREELPLARSTAVTIQHAVHGPLVVEVEVTHSLSESERWFIDAVPELVNLSHTFTASVTYEALAEAIGDRRLHMTSRSREYELMVEAWRGLEAYSLDGRVSGFGRHERDRFTIGTLSVDEVPTRLVEHACGSWRTYLEQYYDAPEAADAILALMDTDDGLTVRRPLHEGGSLLTASYLAVHPMLRGQAVGVRLVLHAMWELVRHPGDLAFLHAHPTESYFDSRDERERFRVRGSDVKRVVAYAQRLGFHQIAPEERITRTSIVPMYRHVGAFGLPFHGLGSLSALAPELAR